MTEQRSSSKSSDDRFTWKPGDLRWVVPPKPRVGKAVKKLKERLGKKDV